MPQAVQPAPDLRNHARRVIPLGARDVPGTDCVVERGEESRKLFAAEELTEGGSVPSVSSASRGNSTISHVAA
ncbi:MAG TPA: hypothetical protein VGA37_15330 [Gemmatimonadales bacterium]